MSFPLFCSPWCDYCDDNCLNDEPCPFLAYPFMSPFDLFDPSVLVDDYGE